MSLFINLTRIITVLGHWLKISRCDREGPESEPDAQGPGAVADHRNLLKLYPCGPTSTPLFEYSELSLDIKALVKQVI